MIGTLKDARPLNVEGYVAYPYINVIIGDEAFDMAYTGTYTIGTAIILVSTAINNCVMRCIVLRN